MSELPVDETEMIEVRLVECLWCAWVEDGMRLGCALAGDWARETTGVEKASSIRSGDLPNRGDAIAVRNEVELAWWLDGILGVAVVSVEVQVSH